MSKFKVGDKVRILDGSKINNYFGNWADGMKKHVGEICTIQNVYKSDELTGYYMKEIGYMWDERGLERIEDKPKNQKIVITHDGKMTTAKFYDGKKVVKTATARCCSSDEFDFNIGAAIALERLTGCAHGHLESTLDSDLQWNRFMASKIALKVPKEKFEKFLKECEERGLRWCTGEQATDWNPIKGTGYTFEKYVYMYHDEDGLLYDKDPCYDYTFEVWGDLDWNAFKTRNKRIDGGI